MAVRALDNAAFGFDTGCFVCEPTNERGLRIPFFHDDGAQMVTAEFTLGRDYSGAPRFVHGGIVLAVLDEAVAWATIAIAGRFAVVRESSTRFRLPVQIGQPHRVEGVVDEQDDTVVSARARVFDAKGRRCAETTARLSILSERMARAAIGVDLGDNARYLRGDKR